MNQLSTILSIAASDPTGGAGIQADIKAAANVGVHCLTALTAVTSQNSSGISNIYLLPKGAILSQVKDILKDVIPDAVKIGMIGSVDNGDEIREILTLLPAHTPIIVDPVLSATAGGWVENADYRLELIKFYKNLFSDRRIIPTPNELEASWILDKNFSIISEYTDAIIEEFNLKAAIVTGGKKTEKNREIKINDTLIVDSMSFINSDNSLKNLIVESPFRDTVNLHGTGCTFSSLLASFLALGENIEDAFLNTKKILSDIIKKSNSYRLGVSTYGPLNIMDYKL